VPFAEVRTNPEHLELLESWLKSYRADELFDEHGALVPELATLPPKEYRRMSANPHTNGGLLLEDLALPDFRDYAVPVSSPGTTFAEATRVLGTFLRDVMKTHPERFRLFGPHAPPSEPPQAVLEATNRSGTPRSCRATTTSHPTAA
jgi:xylulose-5-phosphate/fructose-6-phosphate phosphoketolase